MKRRTARRPAAKKTTRTTKRRTTTPKRRTVRATAKRSAVRRKRANPSAAEAKIIGSKTTSRTVRGTTFRRRFLLVKQGQNLAWMEAGHRSQFDGFVDAPGNDAEHVRKSSIPYAAALHAFNAYVARRGSAW